MASPERAVEFKELNSICSLYEPTRNRSRSKDDPSTIVVCQWMGASSRSRYLKSTYEHYIRMYPGARIISIRSLQQYFLWVSTATRTAALKPVISALQSDAASEARILIHTFSNGGALTVCDICQLYKDQARELLPIKGIIIDSAPGDPGMMEGWNAMSVGLPRNALWYPLAVILWILNVIAWVKQEVLMMPHLVRQTRRRINDPHLVNPTARRLYVYSETDRMVGWRDVERHADEAQGLGVEVIKFKLHDSQHIQHSVIDPERYWEMIEELWESSKK